MKFNLIILILSFYTYLYSQENEEITINSELKLSNNQTLDLSVTYDYSPDKFHALGITLPPFSNWQIGIPHFRFEQSIFLYLSRRPNLNWYYRLTAPFITYDVIDLDVYSNNFIYDFHSIGTYYFDRKFRKKPVTKKLTIAKRQYDYLTSEIPILAQQRYGINFGLFSSRQLSNDGVTVSFFGFTFGYSKRVESNVKFNVKEKKTNNQTISLNTWEPKKFRLDRIFYLNTNVGLNYKLITNYNYSYTLIPIGIHAGWLFFNRSKFKKGFITWNIETGIKNPIFTKLPKYNSQEMAMFYFTFRGFFGGLYSNKS